MPKDDDTKTNKLLEQLALEKKARQEAEDKLSERDLLDKKKTDPMGGPGELCEVTKITKAEAWQLPSRERVNPKTGTEEMISDPVPEGYQIKEGPNNAHYVVALGKKVEDAELIPNCKSKYTREYIVYGPKQVTDRGNFKKEPPKISVILCEKHATMFGARKK